MSEAPRVLLDIEDGIATVTLNRGKKYNGLDLAMFTAIIKTAKTIKKDRTVRAVILRGDGPAFCSGLDVMSMKKTPWMIPQLLMKPGTKISNMAQDVSLIWRDLPVPVIAVTHGKCFGGGFQIALGADFRFSSKDCEFSIMETKWGLIPDMGGSVTLRELVRIDVAKELTMTGRVFDAEEAQKIGIVTRVCDDPLAEARDFATELATRSPDALAAGKKLFQEAWTSDLKTALKWETELQKKILGRWNQLAAASKNLSKDPWDYKKRRRKY